VCERRNRVSEWCREELPDHQGKCGEEAEFILWGKLFPPEALGPRCWRHAYAHCPYVGDPAWAIYDLRPINAAERERALAVSPADTTEAG